MKINILSNKLHCKNPENFQMNSTIHSIRTWNIFELQYYGCW